jgi:LCP family protein required for cell wall assembly
MSRRFQLQSPAAAALLSFLIPGLGQAATGRRQRGLIIALPTIAMLAVLIGVVLFARHEIYDVLFSKSAPALFLVFLAVHLAYRLWAIVDAFRGVARPAEAPAEEPKVQAKLQAGPPRRRAAGQARRSAASVVLGAVLVAMLGSHMVLGAVGLQYNDLLTSGWNPNAPGWFGGDGNLPSGETAPPAASLEAATDAPDPTASLEPSGSEVASPSASASVPVTIVATPGATTASGLPIFPVESVGGPNTPPAQWRDDGMLNVLMVGVDSGAGRWSLRTDTMILLQVEISSGRGVMYGIPRNLENIPLPPESANAFACHCFPYPNLLNGLWRDAVNRPKAYPYPGSDFVRGFKALEGAIGQYLGLHVDGAVVINLMGFVNLVDALGGIDINVPVAITDKQYSRPQDGRNTVLRISAGQQHMNGYYALAYARTRHQDSDYGRMGRQQDVLLALRKTLQPCSLLPKIPSLISALGSAFWTDMPIEDTPALVALAQRVGSGNVKSIELTPSLTGNPVGYLTVPRWATVRNIVAHGLDGVPASSGGGGGGGGGGLSC